MLVLHGASGQFFTGIKAIDSQTFASGSNAKTIKVWNTITRTNTLNLTGHNNTVRGLEYLSTRLLVYL